MAGIRDVFHGMLSPEELDELMHVVEYVAANTVALDNALTAVEDLSNLITATDDPDDLTDFIDLRQFDAAATETVTDGAIAVDVRTTFVTVSGAQAFTLANGTIEGQRKTIICTAADNDGTLTPTSLVGGTTIVFNAVNEQTELEWHAGGWRVVWILGATLA